MAEHTKQGIVLSSRCDVVYKTILRDFRKFYLTLYRKNAKPYKRSKQKERTEFYPFLRQYITEFMAEDYTPTQQTELQFTLGCLIRKKEMLNQKNAKLCFKTGVLLKKKKLEARLQKIPEIHDYLYKFSIDKVETCLKQAAICALFINYME